MGICRSSCHSYNFVNIRFVKVIFFPVILQEELFSWKVYLQGFAVSFFVTCVPLDE